MQTRRMMDDSRRDRRNLIDEPSVARALQVTLVAILVSSLTVFAFTLVLLRWWLTAQLSLVVAAAALLGVVLSHYGRRRAAVLTTFGAISYAVLHASARNDGMQNVGLATVPILIVLASLLLDRLMFATVFTVAMLATIGMLAIRYYVLRLEQLNPGDVGDFFVYCILCAMSALVGSLLSARIQEGFLAIRASERRYRGMFENIRDVYFEMRPDGLLLEISPAAAELFESPLAEIVGRSLAQFCANSLEFDALVEAVLQNGRVSDRELPLRPSCGTPAFGVVNAAVQTGEAGEVTIIGSIHDITVRRRAEEALRESEARLRIALEAAGAGTFDCYPQTGELAWSRLTKSVFGMAPDDDANYEFFLRAVHPDDRERVLREEAAAALPASGGRLASEYRVVGLDGRERWIAVRGRMLFDGKGRATRMIGTTQDISERKRLEEELRRSVEELQKIMDVAPVALITAHDPECSAVTVNRMGNAMFELDAGANSPSDPRGSIPPFPFFRDGLEIPVDQLPLQMAARGVEVRDAELEVLLPSGRTRLLWGHASPLRGADGQVRGAIAAVQDVTEARQRADAMLRESEERFRNTADAAPVILWFGDVLRRLVFVNEQMVRFTGLSAEQLLGDGWTRVIHPDDLERASGVYFQGVDLRASYQLEYRARRADGEYRHMLATTQPRYIGGEYAGQTGSVVDITDLKRRQEEDLARQKLESVGRLASGIAHDFNNLLGSVLAQSELALAELEAGARPDTELKRIGEVARRGAEIVRQLMVYAGKENQPAALIDLSRIVEDMLALLSVSVSKRARLQTDLPANLRPVRGAAAQIRQIVMNLVANASEAVSGSDGEILVTTRPVTLTRAMCEARGNDLRAGDYLQLEVSDNGCGLDSETKARMFDPFFSTKSAGRGLGLAVVQGLVRTLGGAIQVVSEPGKGTSFRVLLPSADSPLAPEEQLPPPGPENTTALPSAAVILIVEDEHPLRQSVSKLLRKRGFSVFEAGDGSAAIEMLRARAGSLDVMLLDITLPGASSRTVLEEARRAIPGIKVIATSAYNEETALASLHGPPDFFIRKPYRLRDLAELVRGALAR